jgi:hypothetical protein
MEHNVTDDETPVPPFFRRLQLAYGAFWHAGTGSKDAMRKISVASDATCEIQLSEPVTGFRRFGCYPSWPIAIQAIQPPFGDPARLMNEIIVHGRPCKAFLDIDGSALPRRFIHDGCDIDTGIARLVAFINAKVRRIYAEDFGVHDLPDEALIWTRNHAKTVSLHLVISSGHVFRSNHINDPQGAAFLALRLIHLGGEGDEGDTDEGDEGNAFYYGGNEGNYQCLLDLTVFSKDREMRCVGSSKHDKFGSVLLPYGDASNRLWDAGRMEPFFITWFPGPGKVLEVPQDVPHAVKKRTPITKPAHTRRHHESRRSAAVLEVCILELVHNKLHASGYREHTDSYGIKLNYSDRTEPCYTGAIHEGSQNFRCFVGNNGGIYAKCFSSKCCNKPAFYIGPAPGDDSSVPSGDASDTPWLSTALKVNMPYIDYQLPPAPSNWWSPRVDDAAMTKNSDVAITGALVDAWMQQKFKALSFRSPMGTGKSTMLAKLIHTLQQLQLKQQRQISVLILTHRQTLALEMSSDNKLNSLGFVNYLLVPDKRVLHDRATYPNVICQVG